MKAYLAFGAVLLLITASALAFTLTVVGQSLFGWMPGFGSFVPSVTGLWDQTNLRTLGWLLMAASWIAIGAAMGFSLRASLGKDRPWREVPPSLQDRRPAATISGRKRQSAEHPRAA